MRNTRVTRLSALLLMLVLGAFFSHAQNNSTKPQNPKSGAVSDDTISAVRDYFLRRRAKKLRQLTESAWKSPVTSFEASDGSVWSQAFYTFEPDNTVTCTTLAMKQPRSKVMLNYQLNPFDKDPYGSQLVGTPPMEQSKNIDSGRYSISTDGVLHITFPGWSVTATVNADGLNGVVTKQNSNSKEEWKLQKTTNEDNHRLQELGILPKPR